MIYEFVWHPIPPKGKILMVSQVWVWWEINKQLILNTYTVPYPSSIQHNLTLYYKHHVYNTTLHCTNTSNIQHNLALYYTHQVYNTTLHCIIHIKYTTQPYTVPYISSIQHNLTLYHTHKCTTQPYTVPYTSSIQHNLTLYLTYQVYNTTLHCTINIKYTTQPYNFIQVNGSSNQSD